MNTTNHETITLPVVRWRGIKLIRYRIIEETSRFNTLLYRAEIWRLWWPFWEDITIFKATNKRPENALYDVDKNYNDRYVKYSRLRQKSEVIAKS
jgi:hypothetical protein